MSKVSINLGGPGFILFVVFLVLKLTGNITWSWLWVTCPLWGGFALLFGFILFCITMAALTGQLK